MLAAPALITFRRVWRAREYSLRPRRGTCRVGHSAPCDRGGEARAEIEGRHPSGSGLDTDCPCATEGQARRDRRYCRRHDACCCSRRGRDGIDGPSLQWTNPRPAATCDDQSPALDAGHPRRSLRGIQTTTLPRLAARHVTCSCVSLRNISITRENPVASLMDCTSIAGFAPARLTPDREKGWVRSSSREVASWGTCSRQPEEERAGVGVGSPQGQVVGKSRALLFLPGTRELPRGNGGPCCTRFVILPVPGDAGTTASIPAVAETTPSDRSTRRRWSHVVNINVEFRRVASLLRVRRRATNHRELWFVGRTFVAGNSTGARTAGEDLQ